MANNPHATLTLLNRGFRNRGMRFIRAFERPIKVALMAIYGGVALLIAAHLTR